MMKLATGITMKKIRKQPVGPLNPWNFSLQPGDRVWKMDHTEGTVTMHDLRDSTGRDKAATGELTPHVVKKNGNPRLAAIGDDGFWYWVD
jgi:hypothetical protein